MLTGAHQAVLRIPGGAGEQVIRTHTGIYDGEPLDR